ncbi:MAG: transposase [Anaerolineae bacterium]
MSKDSARANGIPVLLEKLFELLAAHRPAFRQERPFRRAVALVLGEVFSFARHTVTQMLLALGMTEGDWSGWYRLFSHRRFDEAKLSRCLLRQTLEHVAAEEPYVIGVDSTEIARSSRKMPGTGWSRAPGTAPFRRGLHRSQRFLHGAWLTPVQEGYSRAIPLRLLAAFPPKAVAAEVEAAKEWEAGLEFARWVRKELDGAGREGQEQLVLADGAYDTVEFWRGLPERTVALVRTARNRVLRQLPAAYSGRGRRRKYGERAPQPAQWLKERLGWQQATVLVRGRYIGMRYRVLGPYLRERAPKQPLMLIVVAGATWKAGRKEPRRARREPSFYLVSARWEEGQWRLPLPPKQILSLLWQRWELEVAHREMKTGLGVGDKQCWNRRSAVVSVQWGAWVYGLMVLAGYRAWGLFGGPPSPGPWWRGAKRWSLNTLWRGYRAALWGTGEFRALWTQTGCDWTKKEDWFAAMANSVAAAARG